ncbi:MAG: restriction endonuclease subunit S [Clostridia bacterium]|nr:restriction endonuclease subunit S [Clostridia bacterium]
MSVVIPSLDVQREIVSYIKPIDDKIELNNEINNNLEQQTQAIFKSWFVDFELNYGIMPPDWKKERKSATAI